MQASLRVVLILATVVAPMLHSLARGQQYRVRRSTQVEGTVRAGQDVYPIRESSHVDFVLTIVRRDANRVAEARADVREAYVIGQDETAGRRDARQDVLPAGRRLSLTWRDGSYVVSDAESGRAVPESASELFEVPLCLELGAKEPWKEGQTWSLRGRNLTSNLRTLSLEDGALEGKIERLTKDSAKLQAKLETQLVIEGHGVPFVGRVAMTFGATHDLPTSTEIQGALNGQASIQGEVAHFEGRASMTQTIEVVRAGAQEEESAHTTHEDSRAALDSIAFRRVAEPREKAFTILLPHGWSINGGIYRVNAAQAGGPLNAIEAKCDITFASDERGSVRFRRLPNTVYAVVRGPAAPMFPVGTNYQGAEVRPLMSAKGFLDTLFRTMHPGARNVRVVDTRQLPKMTKAYYQAARSINEQLAMVGIRIDFDTAGMLVDYDEDGQRFRELLYTGITDRKDSWHNSDTIAFRAPAATFEQWRAVFDIMRYSVRLNPQWVLAEAGGQSERAGEVIRVYQEVQRLSRDIARHKSETTGEIMNENYLMLTGQEEFVNPETNEVELDTNEFRYRWKTPGDDVFYTNREDEDPNIRKVLNRSDFHRTPVRKR